MKIAVISYILAHSTGILLYFCRSAIITVHCTLRNWQWSMATWHLPKRQFCQLHVADTLNLTQRDYSSTFIVSMPPRWRQPISSDVRWQIIGLPRSGLKQTDIANQFGVGQSNVSKILSRHRQTGRAKDSPRQGRPKKTNAREDMALARMAIRNTGPTHAK